MKKLDVFITIFSLTMAVFFVRLFWQEYTRTLTKLNEEPVGFVIFKQRTAQRMFADRFVWDMLRQSSPLYNGDTIRTIQLSEVVIVLKDEVSKLTIFENTMIKIFYNDKEGATVDFSQGNLEINSGTARVTVVSGSSVITVEGQTDFILNEQGLSFSVLEGSVNMDGEEIEAGEILFIDHNGERIEAPAIADDSVTVETETTPTEIEVAGTSITPTPTAAQTATRALTPEERAKPFFDRGVQVFNREDFDSAIDEFTEAIQFNPNSAASYNFRGRAFLETGDLDRAQADFEKCIQLDPNIADAYAGIGNIYLIKGDNRAIERLENAVRLEPGNAQYRELLETARRREEISIE